MTETLEENQKRWGMAFKELDELRAQLAAMTAERDALVGAAYVASAEPFRWNECGFHPRDRKAIRAIIRALMPADAIDSLNHIRAQAKAEGMREAAGIAKEIAAEWGSDTCRMASARILAAAEKEPRHD